MNFIYHAVPENMVGTSLLPLNEMPKEMAKLRNKYLQKYKGREEILQRKIDLLDCVWNDVVQFLPLHPQKVFDLQKKLGIVTKIPPYRFFEIDVRGLDIDRAVVFFKTAPGEENTEVKWLKDVDARTLDTIPEATIAYYKKFIGTGELPFNYQFVPHIMYKGSVDISGAKIITLTDY